MEWSENLKIFKDFCCCFVQIGWTRALVVNRSASAWRRPRSRLFMMIAFVLFVCFLDRSLCDLKSTVENRVLDTKHQTIPSSFASLSSPSSSSGFNEPNDFCMPFPLFSRSSDDLVLSTPVDYQPDVRSGPLSPSCSHAISPQLSSCARQRQCKPRFSVTVFVD